MADDVLWSKVKRILARKLARAARRAPYLLNLNSFEVEPWASSYRKDESEKYAQEVCSFLRRLGMEPVSAWPWEIKVSRSHRNPMAYMLEKWRAGCGAHHINLDDAAEDCFRASPQYQDVAQRALEALRFRGITFRREELKVYPHARSHLPLEFG